MGVTLPWPLSLSTLWWPQDFTNPLGLLPAMAVFGEHFVILFALFLDILHFLFTFSLLCVQVLLLYFSRPDFLFLFFFHAFPCDSLHNFPVKAWRDFLDCFVFFLNGGTLFTCLLALNFSTASRLLLGFFCFGKLLLWVFLLFYLFIFDQLLHCLHNCLLEIQYCSHYSVLYITPHYV